MASYAVSYGEVIYETSRAAADDEDEETEDLTDSDISVSLERTEAGQLFHKQTGLTTGGEGVLFVFHGKVAVGFAQGYLNTTNYECLGSIIFRGKEGTVDSLMERSIQKIVVKILQIKGSKSSPPLLFALIDSFAVPRFAAHEVMTSLQDYVTAVQKVIIFHNEPLALYVGAAGQGSPPLYYIRNNSYDKSWIPSSAQLLQVPNLIGGISAAVLSYCEMIDKPGLLLIAYTESDFVDSISMAPFLNAVKVVVQGQKVKEEVEASGSDNGGEETKGKGDDLIKKEVGKEEEFQLGSIFQSYLPQFNIKGATASKTNFSHVSQSNLYI